MWGETTILFTGENSVEKLKLSVQTMLVEVQAYCYNPHCVCGGRGVMVLRTYIRFVKNIEL